ncbi:MAG: hypothetical protein ABI811_07515 [Acidobacteriota bacterium]
MRPIFRSMPVVILTFAAALGVATALKSQVPPGPPTRWDYAVVLADSEARPRAIIGGRRQFVGSAQICYVSADGCKFEAVTQRGEYPQDFDTYPAMNYNQGLAGAAAELGSQGWELTNTITVGENAGTMQMYFRRPKP